MEQSWNKPYTIKTDIESLKNSVDPIIIYALTDEAEAIANACKEKNIEVTMFCDNEIRKPTKPYWDLDVAFTPHLPKNFLRLILF